MKQTILIISAFLFSLLFYSQNIGLNLCLFSILALIILIISNNHKFKNNITILQAFIYLLTSILVFYNHSNLSILANCIAFFSLLGAVSESKSSIYIYWFNGIYTTIAGFFHRNFERENNEEKKVIKKDIDILHWVKMIGIPLIFFIIFIMLYKNGNPVFNTIISEINFSFINFQWLLFSVLGYYLFSNIVNPVQIESVTSSDLKFGNTLIPSKVFSVEKLKKEKQLGTILMMLLNLLIVFYLITDIISLTATKATAASALSNQVHNGINTLIASIIIAIIIILYFFRGDLNFYKHSKMLKTLSYCWIFLNTILVLLIALKNYEYIALFGLTYKRVGVLVYLILTLIGLVTTFLKVVKVKNLRFLLRVNLRVAFILLILFSAVNWDFTITKYNINHAPSIDVNYLINLSDNNAIILKEYSDKNIIKSKQKNQIEEKYNNHIKVLNNRNWQELTYENMKLNANNL